MEHSLKHFYIPEEQSIYLLSHQDAAKLKAWIKLCMRQLERLGYQDIELIGKGAFGFVFAGKTRTGVDLVFKFSRINLPQHVQDRLEEESDLQSLLDHPQIPQVKDFVRVGKQAILVMTRAPGLDLDDYGLKAGRLSPQLILNLAAQLADLLHYLRTRTDAQGQWRPIVHGDIKPSNLVFDPASEQVQLIDWGSSVFSQLDADHQFISNSVMDLMSSDLQHTNAKLGDVYFIGDEQLNGGLSSPRFDEQGTAATLYALASGQGCRFGRKVITPQALGLPIEFARVLASMLDDDTGQRQQAGNYFLGHMSRMRHIVAISPADDLAPMIPVWVSERHREVDTAVYSSRKSFLRQENPDDTLMDVEDEQLDKYYKNYLQGMGETEKAFVAAVSRLGRYPIVGGLAVKWHADGVRIESAFSLHNPELRRSFHQSVNNMVNLARGVYRQGTFKAVMYNARDTLHLDRRFEADAFIPPKSLRIPYLITPAPKGEDTERMHSYFEDGRDPDEYLTLPPSIMDEIEALDRIHHTGCIIFEVLPRNLKIHNYYRLLDASQEDKFRNHLNRMLAAVKDIQGLGLRGFMKLPYKDPRTFDHIDQLPARYAPRNPRDTSLVT
ncbi:protein kinase [Saccharospirillum sp.]|uniref:protein kinase domain-containing protein n=1 Tax=Saccharospirillum sp. TaxID=2033801 RepID=UPI0034A07E59